MSETFNDQDLVELSFVSDMIANYFFPDPPINKQGPNVDSYYQPESLINLGCKTMAEEQPFEVIYSSENPVPEHLQKAISQYSFPSTSREIKMYSGLGTGTERCFHKAGSIFMQDGVRDCLQIGFYISANVIHSPADPKIRHVTVCFDRKHVTFTSCTCINEEDREIIDSQKKHLSPAQKSMSDRSVWCPHVVATCLTRIAHPEKFTYRPPISESLSQLNETQLRTLAYKLICQEGARKFLPATQSIIDEMLMPSSAPCGSYEEGRDPTGGGCMGENPYWCVDFTNLKNRLTNQLAHHIRQLDIEFEIEIIFDLPSSFVDILDVLSSIRSYRPRGAWDLLSIIVKMMHNHDANCLEVLQIFVGSIIQNPAMVKYWSSAERNVPFPSKHVQTTGRSGSFYTSRWLCEALVDVWRLFCLHPKFVSDPESAVPNLGVSRREIVKMLDSLESRILSTTQDLSPVNGIQLDPVGFNPAIRTCLLSWTDGHLPSTLHLTPEQFREAIPEFDGAFVSEQAFVDGDPMWRDSFGESPEFGSTFCPPMCGQFGIDFARCQSLVTHGSNQEVSLSWVRHLALQLLQQSPRLLAAATLALSVQNPGKEEVSSGISNSRPSSSTQSAEAGRKVRSLLRERSAETEALLRNTSVDRFGVILSEWIYCVNYLMDCFYSLYFSDGVVYPPVLTNHNMSRFVMERKVEEGFNPSYYLSYLSAFSTPQIEQTNNDWMAIDVELAFRLGFLILVLPRPQLILKSREVRLMDHDSQLMSRLYSLPLESVCPWVINTLRQEASILAYGPDRFDANVPYALSDFLFTMLAGSHNVEDWDPPKNSSPTITETDSTGGIPSDTLLAPFIIRVSRHRPSAEVNDRKLRKQVKADYELAFALAKRTLSRNSYIPDANFTGCQLYQRRCFFLKMLDYFKNKPGPMCDLVESLLDRTLNPSFKCPPLQMFGETRFDEMLGMAESQPTNGQRPQISPFSGESQKHPSLSSPEENLEGPSTQSRHLQTSRTPATTAANTTGSTSEDTDTVSDSRIRCANLRRLTRHSVGMAAIDSSAPETTSSDNSPTTSRRTNRAPEEAANHHYYHHRPLPGYSTSEEDCQITVPEGSDEKNNDALSRLYLGQDYVEHLIDLSKKVRKIAGGPNASSTFQYTHSTTDLSLQKAAFHISLYALGLCNRLGSAARKSRLRGKIVSWLSREALEMQWPAVLSLIYSWKGAFSIQEITNLTTQFALQTHKEDSRSTRALILLCRSIMPECIAEGPKFLLTFMSHFGVNESIREYLLKYLERNESLIMDSPGFSVYRSEYLYTLATIWLHHLYRGEFKFPEDWINPPIVDLFPQTVETSISPQDLPPVTTEDLCEYMTRVIGGWEEEIEGERPPHLYRALRLFLLTIDEKLPLQTQSKRLRVHQSLCHPRHRYKHYSDKNASQIIEENGGGGKGCWVGADDNKDTDFKNPLDQAILRVFPVAEELKDEEAMVLVLRFLLHRVQCPVLLAAVTFEAIQVFQKLYSQIPAEEMFGSGKIPASRLSIPLLECMFNWTCQLFYNQLERRSNDWREVIDMSLSVHLFYQQVSGQFNNVQISWEAFSHLIDRINPSVFELINSSLESIRPFHFVFPRLHPEYPWDIDIDWISQASETTVVGSRQGGGGGGNGRPNDRRMRMPRIRGRGNGPANGGRTNNFYSRR